MLSSSAELHQQKLLNSWSFLSPCSSRPSQLQRNRPACVFMATLLVRLPAHSYAHLLGLIRNASLLKHQLRQVHQAYPCSTAEGPVTGSLNPRSGTDAGSTIRQGYSISATSCSQSPQVVAGGSASTHLTAKVSIDPQCLAGLLGQAYDSPKSACYRCAAASFAQCQKLQTSTTTAEEVAAPLRRLPNGRAGSLLGYTSEALRYGKLQPTPEQPAPPSSGRCCSARELVAICLVQCNLFTMTACWQRGSMAHVVTIRIHLLGLSKAASAPLCLACS